METTTTQNQTDVLHVSGTTDKRCPHDNRPLQPKFAQFTYDGKVLGWFKAHGCGEHIFYTPEGSRAIDEIAQKKGLGGFEPDDQEDDDAEP